MGSDWWHWGVLNGLGGIEVPNTRLHHHRCCGCDPSLGTRRVPNAVCQTQFWQSRERSRGEQNAGLSPNLIKRCSRRREGGAKAAGTYVGGATGCHTGDAPRYGERISQSTAAPILIVWFMLLGLCLRLRERSHSHVGLGEISIAVGKSTAPRYGSTGPRYGPRVCFPLGK